MPEAMGSMFVHRGQQAHSWWLLPRSERWKELGPAAWGGDYSEMLRCGQGRAGTDGHRAWAWELPCPITPLESEETEVQIPKQFMWCLDGKRKVGTEGWAVSLSATFTLAYFADHPGKNCCGKRNSVFTQQEKMAMFTFSLYPLPFLSLPFTLL